MELFFVAAKRSRRGVLVSLLLLALLLARKPSAPALAAPRPEPEPEIVRAPFYVPVAQVTLNVPANVMLGEDFTFTATFDNTSGDPNDEGYGPFIDIVFPVTGVDGAGTAVDDGIDFLGATYLGAAVTAVQNTFGAANTGGCSGGLGPVTHPYAVAPTTGAPLEVCGVPGDKLVTLQLPFGSFVPSQPPVTVDIHARLSNLADIGTALNFRARGGYQYGATPTSDWCCDPFDATILSHPNPNSTTWPASPVTPRLFTITKAYLGPEDETATGPNFVRQYTVAVDIADGQTLTNLDVSDILPGNMQFVAFVSSAPPSTPVSAPSTSTPGGTLTRRFASVTGGPGTADATMTFSFYIPRLASGGGDVINPATGAPTTSVNQAQATASWTPIDSRDAASPVTGICGTPCHTLTDRSIATQKSVAIATDVAPTGYSSGDTLEYILDFQVSDFFAFDDVVLTDVLSDGQRYDPTFTPTLQVVTGRVTLPIATIIPTVDNSQIGNSGPNPPADGTDGTQTLSFDVTDAIGDLLVGGCIDRVSGGYLASCGTPTDHGPTTGTIVFRALIQQDFTDTYPSGDPSVDHGDVLENALTVSGTLLDHMNPAFPSTGLTVNDVSAADFVIAFGELTKSVYAINGAPCEPCTAQINAGVSPGDTVTFHLHYTQPASNFEETVITDYLPLPVFEAAEVSSFSNTVCGLPAAGEACLGADDTFHSLTTPIPPAPALSTNASANTVSFSYADYDSTVDIQSVIGLLFTVTVMDDPFADGMFLTNQAHVSEGTTNANPTTQDDIIQIRINEPALYLTKAAVSSDNPNRILTPSISAPISFNAPGTGGAGWSGGTINSTYLDANPIDSDMGFVDAGDLIRFAIVVQNRGHSLDGAFDLRIRDTLQPGYVIPGGLGLNLQVFYGNGTGPISWNGLGGGPDGTAGTADDLFGSGIELVDPVGEGVCQSHDPNLGNDIIVITYDLQLDDAITLDQGIINTATLLNYASTPGGPNFIPSGLTDTATVQPVTTPVKSIVSTSEGHTGEAGTGTTGDPRLAAVGEVVRFRIVESIPEGTVTNFRLHDALPPGLIFLNDNTARIVFVSNDSIAPVEIVTSTTLGPDPALHIVGNEGDIATIVPGFPLPDTAVSRTDSTSTADYAANNDDSYASGDDIFFKFGTVNNHDRDSDSEYVILEFNALVANIASNQAGANLDNSVAPRYGLSTTDGASSPVVRTRVVEPTITYSKTIVSLPSPPDAGGVVQYRLSFANANGDNDSAAFDVHLTDALPAQLQLDLASISIALTGGAAGVTNASAANNLDVTIGSVPKGGSVTVDYSAQVLDTVTPDQIITNASVSTWTSLPGTNGTSPNTTGSVTPGVSGSETGERNGTSGGVNDYFSTGNRTFQIASPAAPVKQMIATSAVHTPGSNVAIGEVITYGILLTFPEGTTPSDTVVDDLPSGLTLVAGTPQIISTATASGGLLTGDFSGAIESITISSNTSEGGSVTFAFTNVVLPGDNNVNNNTILLQFQAQVSNIAANITGRTISNSATNQVGTGAPVASNVVTATVVQPSITFTKEIVSLPTPLDAGGVVHYRITYANSGTAADVSTAMDVNITDTLAAALRLPSIGAPDLVITTTAGVGAVTNNSTTSNIDIVVASVPPGESVTVDFYPVIQSSITPGQVIDNIGNSAWTSLSGPDGNERTGAGGPSGSPNNYAAVDDVSFTIPVSQTIVKQLTSTSASHTTGSNVTIGEEITYDILLTLPEGMTPSDTVVDDLPTGLEVVDTPEVITSVAASGGLLTADFNGTMDAPTITMTGTNDIVTFGFTNVSLPGDNYISNNTILLRFRARVLNVDENDHGDILSNTATNQVGAAAPTTSNTVNATVVGPVLNLTKQVTDPTPAMGEVLTFTLLLSHAATSTAGAFDVIFIDDVPAGLTLDLSSVNVTTAGTVTNLQTNHSGNHIEVTADSLGLGATIQVNYTATVAAPYASSFQNDAAATWTSLPGAAAGERDGSRVPGYNDYRTEAHAAISVTRDLVKNLAAHNIASSSPDQIVTIGEILTYQIVLTIPAGTTDLAIVTDTLSSGMAFVDCATGAPVSGMHDIMASSDLVSSSNFTFAAVTHVAGCNHGTAATNNPQISNSGRTIRWDLGRITNSGVAAETITLTYRVVVLDAGTNVQGTTLDNDVDWSWSGGTIATRAAPSLEVTEPELQLVKTVDPEVAALGSTVTYVIEISHTTASLTTAYDVLLTDGIPTGLALDEASVTVTGSAGLPPAAVMTSPTQFSVYWSHFPLGATARVEFQARFVGPSPVVNAANVEWSSLQIDPIPFSHLLHFQPQSPYNALSTERQFNPLDRAINDYVVSASASLRVPRLPKTGFAPGKATILPRPPADFAYAALGDLWLEIPRLGVKVSIVGVPFKAEDWNLTWLGDQAGYLAGTAYPTHAGNTGLTAHAYLADGRPGPFVDLNKLRYGDQVIVHIKGQRYIYEVRENKLVRPNDPFVLKHEEYPWLTLITCKTYNEATGDYQFRVVVRAVLVKVENE